MYDLQEKTKNFHILYVEDDETSREQLQEIFELLFASVDIAADGIEGLEKYKQKSYDIVITDINMPRMDGLEFIEHIREINESQKVIILSAHNDSQNLLKAIDVGVDRFLIKPLKMEQLKYILLKVAKEIHATKLVDNYYQELEKEVEYKTEQLRHQVITDDLTGALNRIALLEDSKKVQKRVVLLLNIDNFDSLNVTYGYDNGDVILQEVTRFLQKRLDEGESLYRLCADEFVIVSYTKTLKQMSEFAKKIQEDMLHYSLKIDDFHIKFTFTMALAQGEECLLKHAHIALKDAHKIGRNQIAFYDENSQTERLQLKIQQYMPTLTKVIEKEHITPYFQAIINNETNEIEKYECLARIVHEDGSVQTPFEFLDVAELTGMLPSITRIMIDKSFKAFANNEYEFSINISEHDLNDGYLRAYLQEKLKEYGIDASRVVIEVLEGISAIGAQASLEQLLALKEDGFSIAIDDFGVQNSNFERVNAMQVDYIKIDGSFIKNIASNPKSFSVAKTINDFSKSIGAKVVAEFVHSKEVQDIVRALGIEYSQGYYFSEPKADVDVT